MKLLSKESFIFLSHLGGSLLFIIALKCLEIPKTPSIQCFRKIYQILIFLRIFYKNGYRVDFNEVISLNPTIVRIKKHWDFRSNMFLYLDPNFWTCEQLSFDMQHDLIQIFLFVRSFKVNWGHLRSPKWSKSIFTVISLLHFQRAFIWYATWPYLDFLFVRSFKVIWGHLRLLKR